VKDVFAKKFFGAGKELRTPLNAIIGLTEMVVKQALPQARAVSNSGKIG
jgi:signal transduction histidine kinase